VGRLPRLAAAGALAVAGLAVVMAVRLVGDAVDHERRAAKRELRVERRAPAADARVMASPVRKVTRERAESPVRSAERSAGARRAAARRDERDRARRNARPERRKAGGAKGKHRHRAAPPAPVQLASATAPPPAEPVAPSAPPAPVSAPASAPADEFSFER
jgi:hypothetical protein